MTAVLAMEGLGYGCCDNGLILGLNGQMWTVQTSILKFGTEKQKQRFLPDLSCGNMIGAYAITEPDAGSDVYSLRTSAEKRDDGYVLNGKKTLITLGPIADVTSPICPIPGTPQARSLRQMGLVKFEDPAIIGGFWTACADTHYLSYEEVSDWQTRLASIGDAGLMAWQSITGPTAYKVGAVV